MTRRSWQTGVLAGAVGLAALTGCGSSHKASSPPPSKSPGAEYEQITAPLAADVAKAPPSAADMGPYAAVLADAKKARDQLYGYVFPTKAGRSVSNMEKALLLLSTAKAPSALPVILTVVRIDDQAVRTDLGLPARSSTAFQLQGR